MSLTQLLLMIHLYCIAITLGIGFADRISYGVSDRLGGDMAKGIFGLRDALRPYLDFFIVALLASGLLLFWAKYNMHTPNPWFHIKMSAVVIWIVFYVLLRLRIHKMKAMKDASLAKLARTYAWLASFASTAALILAVMTFAA